MPASLLERLGELTDPRGRRGRQYGFVPLLGLCRVAILAGHTTPTAIADLGRRRRHRPDLAVAMLHAPPSISE